MLLQSFVLQEKDMVLLHQTRFSKLEQISHFKFIHNPPCIYSPRAYYNKHGWMEGLNSISNLEKDILDLHTSHLEDMKTYRIDVPSTPSLVEYLDWMI